MNKITLSAEILSDMSVSGTTVATSGRVGERTTVKIGEGKKNLVLDLPVPATPPR